MMNDCLKVEICGVPFENPIIAASGTFGYGLEYAESTDLNKLGGISVKGISMKETEGNPMPRIYETTSGMLNAIGLQNVGVDRFINEKLPLLRKYNTRIIVNFWGKTVEEYVEVALLSHLHQASQIVGLVQSPRRSFVDDRFWLDPHECGDKHQKHDDSGSDPRPALLG